MTIGILMLAHGPQKYVEQAKALARSIRLRRGDVPLAVATDRDAAAFGGLFDAVIPWRFGRWPGAACKLELFDITPFETTLAIDTDCLSIRGIDRVFDHFTGYDFTVYGVNSSVYAWADGTNAYRRTVDAPSYPSFNGGVYYFRKEPIAREVFERAQRFSTNYASLGLKRPRGHANDELLISLAMASLGLRAQDDPGMVVMVAPEGPPYEIDIDVIAGRCRFQHRGHMVEPEIIHFVGPRDRIAAYSRERLALRWPMAPRRLCALAAETSPRIERVIAGVRRRLG